MNYRITFLLMWNLVWMCPGYTQQIPTPKSHFGFHIGDDYTLANYTQTASYFRKLAEASDRVVMERVGITSEGRDHDLFIISSPTNLENIETYRDISRRLARAEMDEQEAQELALNGKAVVWIDGGLHSTETVATQQLTETFYQLVSRDDPETLRILDDVIILLFNCNPDGQELVSDWYMQHEDTAKRAKNIPTMYHKYAGHDNNRDFYMNNLTESTTISRLQYIEWLPQIIYNHHQSGPAGSILAGPPYRDPFNYVLDPLLITGIDGVAAAMINRLNAEGKPGYTRLDGSVFSTWWNGGLRTTPYYHNSIGILTEVVGDPTPKPIPLVPDRLIPNNDTPNPVTPRPWHFRQAIDYSVSLNYAVLDYASRHSDQLLYNVYRMGRNAIEKGSRDTWTLKPAYIDGIKASTKPEQTYDSIFHDPGLRDPRGFVIPANQFDFPRAVHFVNALLKSGIRVHRATADFQLAGKEYPTGSYVVKTDQAFRPHVLDMFEPQDHPNDIQYPGGPPVRPYDAAGWTLAFQFGIVFDRILDTVEGPLEALPYGQLQQPPRHSFPTSRGGYLLDTRVNNSFVAVNALLAREVSVSRTTISVDGVPAGSFYVPAPNYEILRSIADTLGIAPVACQKKPKGLQEIKPCRIALYDHYGGSMPSGWTRWLLEQYRFDHFHVIYPKDIDAGDLHEQYDVILFIGSSIPAVGRLDTSRVDTAGIPAMYHHMLGRITSNQSVPRLREFVEQGGTIVTVGRSASLAYHFELPVENALTARDSSGAVRPLRSDEFYAPGSIHRIFADNDDPAVWGMPEQVNVVSSNSPVFRLSSTSANGVVKPLAWYDTENPLLSGWIWGADYIRNGVAAFSAQIGKGTLVAYGPEIIFRAQSHGTFKLLFNQLYRSEEQ